MNQIKQKTRKILTAQSQTPLKHGMFSLLASSRQYLLFFTS